MSSTSKHYDVVVLGVGIGSLVAAALLARRSWRVLVLGHGYRRSTYQFDGLSLARRPFTFLAASSPAWGRILVELAQTQTFKRRLQPLDPMLQILGPNMRLDLPPEPQVFAREIDREFPAVRRVVDDLYAELARTNSVADSAFERDVVWPPGGFWERRETARVLATLPWLDGADFLVDFPRDHAFRDVVTIPARFASDLEGDLPPFAVARLHGAWTRGVQHLTGGEDELVDFLLERVRAHGGEARLGERAVALVQKSGSLRGVQVEGDDSPLGVTFVVGSEASESLLDLARATDKTEHVVASSGVRRFVVSLVVRSVGIPALLATESFLLPAALGGAVHLQRSARGADGTTLLVAEALSTGDVGHAREEVLSAVLKYLPFLEEHLLLCDSPHDGRPLWDFRNAGAVDTVVGDKPWALRAHLVDRTRLRASGGSLEPEPMLPQYRVVSPQLSGLAGESLRTPLGNVFVAGRSVLPALGQEGELLAAWGVARIITRTDKRKEKMLREMWSKVELS